MSQRRSLSSAIELTPEKMAFIQGRSSDRSSPPPEPQKERGAADEPSTEGDIEVEVAERTQDIEGDTPPNPSSARARRASRPRAPRYEPPAGMMDHFRIPVTTRLHPETADALRRAHLEQKLKRQSPATQQEIVEAALQDWLKENGYLA